MYLTKALIPVPPVSHNNAPYQFLFANLALLQASTTEWQSLWWLLQLVCPSSPSASTTGGCEGPGYHPGSGPVLLKISTFSWAKSYPPSPIPISMMVRYLVLHLLARLLHIQLEGNGQDEEEGIKVDMRIKTKKKRRQEVNDGKVENTGGVAAEGWKKGWEEEEEEKSVENWTTLIGLELGARLARLENFQVFIQDCCTGWHQEWKQAWKLTRDISRRRKQGNSLRWSGNMPPLSSIGTQALYLYWIEDCFRGWVFFIIANLLHSSFFLCHQHSKPFFYNGEFFDILHIQYIVAQVASVDLHRSDDLRHLRNPLHVSTHTAVHTLIWFFMHYMFITYVLLYICGLVQIYFLSSQRLSTLWSQTTVIWTWT